MEFIRIKETVIYVEDLERIRDFYERLLGLPLLSYLPGKHIFFRAGSSVLLFFNPEDSITKSTPPPHYGGGKQHFAFEVSAENYEPYKMELIGNGVQIVDEVTWKTGAKSFYFEDPAGNVLEILPENAIWDA